jgi:hypothetical protein
MALKLRKVHQKLENNVIQDGRPLLAIHAKYLSETINYL